MGEGIQKNLILFEIFPTKWLTGVIMVDKVLTYQPSNVRMIIVAVATERPVHWFSFVSHITSNYFFQTSPR